MTTATKFTGTPHPRYDEAHNERYHTFRAAIEDAIHPIAHAHVYVTPDGDLYWGSSYGESPETRKALLHWLDVMRKDIKDYQRKHGE